jgi:hypothetical protein
MEMDTSSQSCNDDATNSITSSVRSSPQLFYENSNSGESGTSELAPALNLAVDLYGDDCIHFLTTAEYNITQERQRGIGVKSLLERRKQPK